VSPETAPEPAASADTAVAPPTVSERVSLLYRATEARATSASLTVAKIGQEMLSAVGATAIAPKQVYQAQLGTVVQQLLDTRIDVRDDAHHAEPGRHERTDRPYRTDVTA
jgi:hypothetical protein